MLNRNSQNCKNCFELTALVGRYPFPQKIVMQKDDGGEEMLKLKSDRVNRFSHPQLEIGKNKKNIISAIIIRWASHLNLSRILYRMKCSLKHIKPQ